MRNRFRRGVWMDRHQAAPTTSAPVTTQQVADAPLVRGGKASHPQWFCVMAALRRPDGLMAYEFVAECPTSREAILAASRYAYRAVVLDPSSRSLFDNWKAIEQISEAAS